MWSKYVLTIVFFMSTPMAFAGLMVEVDYGVGYHVSNTYQTSQGTESKGSFSVDARFVGLGARYILESTFTDGLDIEPFVKIFTPAKDRDMNKLNLYEVGLSLSHAFGRHQPFGSVIGVLAENTGDSVLDYEWGLSFQAGYRFNFDDVQSVSLTHTWAALRSENQSFGIFDQRSLVSIVGIGYGYKFF